VKEHFAAIYTAAPADILDARGLREQTLPPGSAHWSAACAALPLSGRSGLEARLGLAPLRVRGLERVALHPPTSYQSPGGGCGFHAGDESLFAPSVSFSTSPPPSSTVKIAPASW
jgi:hypothetical protein